MKHYNIPIFVPHMGCPFDCVFCNQRHITSTGQIVTEETVSQTIEQYLSTLPKQNCMVEAAFFGGSFTGIAPERQEELLSAAYRYVQSGDVQGIRLSTRPDYISWEILDRLNRYGVTSIELGVQSMDEEVLKASGRGHTREDVFQAVKLIREYPFQMGLQMMTGLPKDTPEKSIQTAQALIRLNPDHVRIYPTLVIQDTQLERLYNMGKYRPQTVEEAVNVCKRLLILFEAANIPVIRMALAVTEEISPDGAVVAGPFHPAFREMVEAAVYYDKIKRIIGDRQGEVLIGVNDREISKAIGNQQENKRKFKQNGIILNIKGKQSIPKGQIELLN